MKPLVLTNIEPVRIDIALAKNLNISRARAQKLIEAGAIFVDDVQASGHQLVTGNDHITINEALLIEKPAKINPIPDVEVLFEDENVIVFNKPAGLLVHPTSSLSSESEPTLVDVAKTHCPTITDVGDDKARAGLVHRLDKEASGVIIVAKTKEAFAHLKQQFVERNTEKHYTVLVMGSVLDDSGTITFPIGRSKTKARMAARPHSQDGKDAITHYDVLARYTSSTLLDVRIETGRTHQIRAHMFALGNPVAGDGLYVKKGLKQMDIHRLFLHARTLSITLPDQERHTFTAPLPKELQEILDHLTPTTKRVLPGIGSI